MAVKTVFGVLLSILIVAPALADRDDRGRDRDRGKEVHGAPGPIAGAGLPILAVGYGVYWLIKRRRKAD
jgi:hypothetical protein